MRTVDRVLPALPGYPGRGIVAFRDDGGELWWMYFLTGRSPASRQRAFQAEPDRLAVVPKQEACHDILRHYTCARMAASRLIVGNGDHVDQLTVALTTDLSLVEAIKEFEPEPDPPILTPRLAIIYGQGTEPVEILTVHAVGDTTQRLIKPVELARGQGVIVHTYRGDTTTVTSDARPRLFEARSESPHDLAATLWDELDDGLRVGLALGRAPGPNPVLILSNTAA